MTDEELLMFIRRIREMCQSNPNRTELIPQDRYRLQSALLTLQGILERQHADDEKIDLVRKLRDDYAAQILGESSTTITRINSLHVVIERARERRKYDEAHRGCR